MKAIQVMVHNNQIIQVMKMNINIKVMKKLKLF